MFQQNVYKMMFWLFAEEIEYNNNGGNKNNWIKKTAIKMSRPSTARYSVLKQ
jgi:hypothetical protein